MGRTIDSELNKDSNILNGSATVFPITFDVTYDVDGNAEHIACKRTSVDENGNINEVDLVAGTDFTTSGKNVVYADAVNYSGGKLVKYRNVPKTQTQNFDNNGDNTPEDIGKALNKLTLMVQQLSEAQGRNVKLSIAESGDMTLPAQAVRASSMLGCDVDGKIIAGEGITCLVTEFVKTLCDDADASTFLTTLLTSDEAVETILSKVFNVGDVVESYASSKIGFLLENGKTLGKSVSGADYTGEKYRNLFNHLKNFPDYGNTGSEDFDSGDTVYLPDQAFQYMRGAINGSIEAADWDTIINITVDLGRSDLPDGTPFRIDAVPTGLSGLSAGTTYYLGIYSGTEYYLYDTEAHANTNDGATGKISFSGTVAGDCNYTGVGSIQKDAMQRIYGQFYVCQTGGVTVNGAFTRTSGGNGAVANSGGYVYTFDSANSIFPNPAKTNDQETRVAGHQINYFIKY